MSLLSIHSLLLITLILPSCLLASPVRIFTKREHLEKKGSYPGWNYDDDKVRGVNLGGWFLLEPYITPSLFEAFGSDIPVDEYNYCRVLGKEEAAKRLHNHWSTFYTESDFYDMVNKYGLNHVRIPIGYWAFKPLADDPYVQGAEEYFDKAIEWARAAGLKVWVDLHGAPGSQNGFDNSGLRDRIEWPYGDNVQHTLSVIEYIAKKYGSDEYNDVITAIELLNEPLGPAMDMNVVRQFYIDGYKIVRASSNSRAVAFSDAFQAIGAWENFFRLPEYHFTILDHHQYQVFSPGELSRNIDEHVGTACGLGHGFRGEYHWNVVGEWSAALTDCTKWLNGVGRGARYDGNFGGSHYIGSCDNINNPGAWGPEQRTNYRKYVEAQLEAYEQGAGWFFWCYKTENAVEWDFRRLVEEKIFPVPFEERQFPNICHYY